MAAWRSLSAVAVVAPLMIVSGCEGFRSPGRTSPEAPGTGAERAAGPTADLVNRAMVDQSKTAMVRKAQARLARLGYQPGRPDGIAGSSTRRAILHFQTDIGLPKDGAVSSLLLDHLSHAIADRPKQPMTWLPGTLPKADYRPGDTFVYSDGRVETVVAARNGRVSWRSNQGTTFETYKNFVLPRLTWRSPAERGQRLVRAAPDLLWPLMLGEEMSFTASRFVQYRGRPDNRQEIQETWRCSAQDRAQVSLVTGTFDTVRIACERAATDSAPRRKRIWYYAPRLRHYVRVVDLDETSELERRVDLVAMQMTGTDWPPIVRMGLRRTLERAVKNLPDGESTVWESSAIGARVTIQPIDQTFHFKGTRCRTLWQTFSKAGKERTYAGLACRDQDGRWQVAGFQDGKALPGIIAPDHPVLSEKQ